MQGRSKVTIALAVAALALGATGTAAQDGAPEQTDLTVGTLPIVDVAAIPQRQPAGAGAARHRRWRGRHAGLHRVPGPARLGPRGQSRRGRLIASGPTDAVLRDEGVRQAYLGTAS